MIYVLPGLLAKVLGTVIQAFLTVWLIKILGARAEQTGEGVFDLAFRSILPSIYWLLIAVVLGFLTGMLLVALNAVLALLLPATGFSWMILFGVLPIFLLYTPIVFILIAVALRDEGPVSAVQAGFSLFWHHPVQAFCTMIMALLETSGVTCALIWAFYMGIPLYFSESFNLAHLDPVWYGVFAAALILYMLAWIGGLAFFVVTFLNLDYAQNRGSFEEEQPTAEQIQLQQDMAQMERALPPAQPAQTASVEELAVTTASIRLATDTEEVKEHLDAVYSPENAKVQEYMHQEEDRMPTILFDEDMAKELEESRKQWENRNKKEDRPEDPNGGSIKISKR